MTTIAIVIFTIYFVFTQTKFGWTKDISSTFYKLGDKGWLFQVTLTILSALMLVPLMELRESSFKLFEFLIVGGVMFVAVAPNFKVSLEGPVHKISALVAGVSFVIVATLMGLWFLPLALILIALLITAKIGNPVLWLETMMVCGIFLLVFMCK